MRTINYNADLCVVGGGLSGLCCAVAASRHGIKTVLVQDRPMLGGNASSEIRMHICGAHGENNLETGIIEELKLENYYRNQARNYSIWDTIMYEKARNEENLTVLLNSACFEAEMDGDSIKSIRAWQSNAETFHVVTAKYFADCSGDSILAPLSGAEYRYGRESKDEFGESIPPAVADKKTMGMSCLMQIRETDHKVEFIPPEWAYKYETEEELKYKPHEDIMGDNFWWLEIGGEWDCIHDTDRCRDELLKIAFGVWDHVKNYGDHGMDNYELEWIGMLPGKRESRRYVGEYTVTENDVLAEGKFHDTVAYAGWTMDDHFPGGFNYKDGYPTIFHPAPSPWGLPLRCMISKNIKNLVFAGRNISVTHAALSSSRVMATCALLGQALGTAISQAFKEKQNIRDIDINTLQQTLMKDDCYLPGFEREVSPLSKNAKCSAEVVRNGKDRFEENLWKGNIGDTVTYTYEEDIHITNIRLVFDSNLNREHLNREYKNQPSNYPLEHKQANFLPDTIIKEYKIVGTNSNGNSFEINVSKNRQRLVNHRVNWCVNQIEFVPVKTHGADEFRLFSFEIE